MADDFIKQPIHQVIKLNMRLNLLQDLPIFYCFSFVFLYRNVQAVSAIAFLETFIAQNIGDIMIYINVERTLFQMSNNKFHVRVGETRRSYFEYVCEKDGLLLSRKRK